MNKADLVKLGFTTEMLEKIDLSEKVLDKIIILHGKGIEAHKAKLEMKDIEIGNLNGQLGDANKAIEGFKKLDPDAIQKAADTWEAKANEYKEAGEKAEADGNKKVAAMKFDNALNSALTEAGAKDPKDIVPHLNAEMLKVGDDDKFVGLSEQLESLKKSKDYLFTSEEETIQIVAGTKKGSVVTDKVLDAALEAAGVKPEGD